MKWSSFRGIGYVPFVAPVPVVDTAALVRALRAPSRHNPMAHFVRAVRRLVGRVRFMLLSEYRGAQPRNEPLNVEK